MNCSSLCTPSYIGIIYIKYTNKFFSSLFTHSKDPSRRNCPESVTATWLTISRSNAIEESFWWVYVWSIFLCPPANGAPGKAAGCRKMLCSQSYIVAQYQLHWQVAEVPEERCQAMLHKRYHAREKKGLCMRWPLTFPPAWILYSSHPDNCIFHSTTNYGQKRTVCVDSG